MSIRAFLTFNVKEHCCWGQGCMSTKCNLSFSAKPA